MVQKTMSNLEREVMAIIWDCTSCSVRDVMKKLANKKLAYTSVATILHRLYEKGIVTRNSQGNTFIYSPRVTKETYAKRFAQAFMKKFFSSFEDTAIASFAASIEKLPKEKREYLLKLVADHEKNK